MEPLKHLIDGIPDYEQIILCKKCFEKVEELEEKYGGNKDFEGCVGKLREIENEKTKTTTI